MRADAVRNRHRVLSAAAAALAESGPDVPLEEIAGRAGVGIGTLYRHFPDRQALLIAVYREGFDALAAMGSELAESDDPGAALRRFLEANLDFSRSHRALAADVITAALDQLAADQQAADQQDEGRAAESPLSDSPCQVLCARGTELLQRAQRAGAVRSDVDIDQVMRLVTGIAMATDGSSADRRQSGHLLGLVFDGLQARCDESGRNVSTSAH